MDVTERVRWLAASELQRVDPPTEGLFIVIDYKAGRMSTVRLSDQLVFETPAPPQTRGGYVQRGESRVAGLLCTDWETTASDGRRTTACITADGVTLRAESGGQTLFFATSVAYAPQDPSLFAAPSGFTVRRMEAAR